MDTREMLSYPPRIFLQERVDYCDVTHCSHFHYINRICDINSIGMVKIRDHLIGRMRSSKCRLFK